MLSVPILYSPAQMHARVQSENKKVETTKLKRKANGRKGRREEGANDIYGRFKTAKARNSRREGTPSPQTAILAPRFHMVVGRECRVRSCQNEWMDTVCDGESMRLPKQTKLLSLGG